jgi:AcrR family transcriptional regulator
MRAPRQPPRTLNRVQQRTPRQTELLDQLEELFLREGFAQSTLDDIVGKLRCSKMTLYTLAPSREQLILAVLRRFFEQASGRINMQLARYRSSARRTRAVLEATIGELRRITPTCFDDVLGYSTTHELYEHFTRSCSELLLNVLSQTRDEGGDSLAASRFTSEVVRILFDEIVTGELERTTGLNDRELLEHLFRLVQFTNNRPTGTTGARIERIR